MPNEKDSVLREVLPIPDRVLPGLTTYDAEDPDTSYLEGVLCSSSWSYS